MYFQSMFNLFKQFVTLNIYSYKYIKSMMLFMVNESCFSVVKSEHKASEFLVVFKAHLKDNSTMYKIETQIVAYGILYLNPSSYQCQPSHKKYIAVLQNRSTGGGHLSQLIASKQAAGATKSLAVTLLLMTNGCTSSLLRGY